MTEADLILLSAGDTQATVSPLAASLRSLKVAGQDLAEPWPHATAAPSGSGIALAPWANRVAHAQWHYDGAAQQLDITEPGRNNAIHGLLRNTGYDVVERTESSVTLEARIWPQHGYPFQVLHRVQYTVSAEAQNALTVQQSASNEGGQAAPVVLGAHPFLRLGELETGELTLTVPAHSVFRVDEGLIPTELVIAEGADDLSKGVRVSALDIDQAYTGLKRDSDSIFRATLSGDAGQAVYLWLGVDADYVHVFVTETFTGRAKAVALEPMTGPADAFNSGTGLRWVQAGGTTSLSWGIGAARLHELAR